MSEQSDNDPCKLFLCTDSIECSSINTNPTYEFTSLDSVEYNSGGLEQENHLTTRHTCEKKHLNNAFLVILSQ